MKPAIQIAMQTAESNNRDGDFAASNCRSDFDRGAATWNARSRRRDTQPSRNQFWLELLSKPACSQTATLLLCFVAWLLCGCVTTTTGEKTKPDRMAIAQLRTVSVQVEVQRDFTVVLARDELNDVGYLTGGIFGMLAQESAQINADAKTAERMRPRLEGFDSQTVLRERLVAGLQNTGCFSSVTDASATPAPTVEPDAVLVLRVKCWGLRTGMGKDATKRAQAVIDVDVFLRPREGGKHLWARADYFAGGAARPVDDFSKTEGLLKKEIGEAFSRYADRIVNEIRFMR